MTLKKKERSNDVWYSPPFYTHLGGYRICLGVHANGIGDGEGTHVTVAVHLMRGEFDDLLKWPFHGEVTIQCERTTRSWSYCMAKVIIDEHGHT